jgi:hypothetical protein
MITGQEKKGGGKFRKKAIKNGIYLATPAGANYK